MDEIKTKKYFLDVIRKSYFFTKMEIVIDNAKNIKILNYIFKEMIKKYENNEFEKLETMASSVHNFPMYILGKYSDANSNFYKEHLMFYNRIWKEDFMNEYKQEFGLNE